VLSVYAKSLGASYALAALVVSAYGLTQLLTRIPIGFVSDLHGRRKPFVLVGLVAAIVGCLGLAWSTDPWMFASYFAHQRAAHAMSVITFVNGSAQAISGLAGGIISQQLGTVAAFYVGAGLAVVGLATMTQIREDVRPRPSPISLRRLGSIAGTPVLIVSSLIALVNTSVNFTTTQSFTPIYAKGFGASDSQLGLLWTIAIVAMTLASLASARAADRFGDRRVIVAGMLISALATALVPLTTSLVGLLATQVISGAGRGICTPTLMSLGIRAVPSHERASAMGIYQAVYSVGMFAAPPLAGAVADQYGVGSVFILMAVFSAIACVWAALTRGLNWREA
jgi:MFS family permease